MILIFETGNTSTTIVVRDDDNIKFVYKILDDQITNENDLSLIINNLFELNDCSMKDIKIAIISSVVKEIEEIEKKYCELNNIKSINIKDKNIKVNFKNRDDLGSDIIANIFNCVDLYKDNFLVIDMGTATTFMIVKNKEIIGGSIIGGVKTILNSLSANCDLLPNMQNITKVDNILGQTTEECMLSGTYYGYIGILREIIDRIKIELDDQNLQVIMTGGYSNIFIDKLTFVKKVIPDLTIEGIYKIYKFNKKNIDN